LALAQEFELVEPSQHDIKGFSCGKPLMDQFLARHATKHMKMGLSSTWVLPVIEDPTPIKAQLAAYYTLASSTVVKDQIPFGRSLPSYQVPTVLLARLAVADPFKRQGLGEKTLIKALRKAVEVSDAGLPALGLILDVLDKEALGFYQHFEMFEPFTDDPMRLFVPMTMLQDL
jgi:GNAT superfamily N-acetyltransferase